MENTDIKNIIDIDGNTYNLVQIKKQIWTKENLNVSKYRNGDEIPFVQDNLEWGTLTTGAWCYYENKDENGTTYGKLYNWFAVNDPRGLAPEGFHIPSNEEWSIFTKNIGGQDLNDTILIAGGKMKEKGNKHWQKPNKDASNDSGFTGIPGGIRNLEGRFIKIGLGANWWSSSEENEDITRAWFRSLTYNYGSSGSGTANKVMGYSVRCIKD